MFSSPPRNHLANGSFHSSTRSHGLNQCSSLRDLGPETFGIVLGFLVKALVFGPALDLGPGAELVGRFEDALFVQNGIDGVR